MINKVKRLFPWLYDYYCQLLHLIKIFKIKRLKKKNTKQRRQIISKMYFERIGHTIDWEKLQTYTEKMQWEKLNNLNPLKTTLSDKYLVREWVINKIGSEYLIPLLGVWNSFNEINFNTLPDQFVLKTNHGSGTNLIIKNKNEINLKKSKQMFDNWMEIDFAYTTGFELHYSNIKRKIIAEKYLETNLGELQDYKFICFDSKPYYCWVDLGRFGKHTRTVFDLNWNLQPWTQASYGIYKNKINKPEKFDKMIELVTILCQGFSQVRVDLYNVEGRIYFGEMTFTNGSGFDQIVPEEYDLMLGNLWNIELL